MRLFTAIVFAVFSASAFAQAAEQVLSLAKKEKPALIETMKALVSIESGSGDREGLDRISDLIAERLKSLGGAVELVEPGADSYRMFDTPERIGRMVHARFQGGGKKKILLIAHMDTVYLKGMLAQQPFRIDGDRAYGLGLQPRGKKCAQDQRKELHTFTAARLISVSSRSPCGGTPKPRRSIAPRSERLHHR